MSFFSIFFRDKEVLSSLILGEVNLGPIIIVVRFLGFVMNGRLFLVYL